MQFKIAKKNHRLNSIKHLNNSPTSKNDQLDEINIKTRGYYVVKSNGLTLATFSLPHSLLSPRSRLTIVFNFVRGGVATRGAPHIYVLRLVVHMKGRAPSGDTGQILARRNETYGNV